MRLRASERSTNLRIRVVRLEAEVAGCLRSPLRSQLVFMTTFFRLCQRTDGRHFEIAGDREEKGYKGFENEKSHMHLCLCCLELQIAKFSPLFGWGKSLSGWPDIPNWISLTLCQQWLCWNHFKYRAIFAGGLD